MKKYINTLIFLVCAFAVLAQAPQKFNYQAVARNVQGTFLPNQNVKIRASILNVSANGTSQYSETHSVTTSQLGLFNLAIGGGTVLSGNFANITWASSDKFLKIEMDVTGGNNFSLVGTSQLLSVPYALSAGNGSQWQTRENGLSGEEIYYFTGNVGIGCDSIFTSINNNYGPYSSGGGTYPQNWGIGLHVQSESNRALFLLEGQYGSRIHLADNSGPVNRRNFVIHNGSYSGVNAIRFSPLKDNLNGVDYNGNGPGSSFLTLYPENGNVRIGEKNTITTPTAGSKLQISDGDIYIEDSNRGVIMKSPNGQCWRMTVSNTGQPVFTSITCP